MTRKLLGRFIAVLDLHELEALDEETIIATYAEHPEQLAIKLSYLTLQCQMVVLDATMNAKDRRAAVRRVFLDYVLMPPDPAIDDLTIYVNQITLREQYQALKPIIESIEETLDQAPRRQWQDRWFSADSSVENANLWSVIIASPRYEDDGWAELRRHQRDWPEAYFELDGPFDLESPFYAVVAGRNLSPSVADELIALIKADGMASDAFRWKVPEESDGLTSSNTAADPSNDLIRPTPPRPALDSLRDALLSQ
ncbi:MAG: hypothetical protein ACRBM6_16255 [Geminicoccales bacterium]